MVRAGLDGRGLARRLGGGGGCSGKVGLVVAPLWLRRLPGSCPPTMSSEIALQRDYLAIEEVRFPERLLVDIDMPDHLARARVPGMILQPLVENSVRYAVARSTTPVHVTIEAFGVDEWLHLVVADDGPGLGESGGGGFGIGLSNVRDRLRARFGARARVVTGQSPGGGYRTELIMPLDFNNGR